MYCKICGDERTAEYRPAQRQTLCNSCWEDTPHKVGRDAFDAAYWKREDGSDGRDDVPLSTRNEFYSDYLASNLNLADYTAHTTSATM